MTDTVPAYLAEARRLLGASAEGRWSIAGPWPNVIVYTHDDSAEESPPKVCQIVREYDPPNNCNDDPNAQFLVAAHNDLVPTLCRMVEEYREYFEALTSVLDGKADELLRQVDGLQRLLAKPAAAFREEPPRG